MRHSSEISDDYYARGIQTFLTALKIKCRTKSLLSVIIIVRFVVCCPVHCNALVDFIARQSVLFECDREKFTVLL